MTKFKLNYPKLHTKSLLEEAIGEALSDIFIKQDFRNMAPTNSQAACYRKYHLQGMSGGEIAEDLGLHKQNVYDYKKKAEIKYANQIQFRGVLKEKALEAVWEVLEEYGAADKLAEMIDEKLKQEQS